MIRLLAAVDVIAAKIGGVARDSGAPDGRGALAALAAADRALAIEPWARTALCPIPAILVIAEQKTEN